MYFSGTGKMKGEEVRRAQSQLDGDLNAGHNKSY
jgi:hypothetical protein